MKRVAFKMKLTGFEKTNKKRYDERVANLWPNRLIGATDYPYQCFHQRDPLKEKLVPTFI